MMRRLLHALAAAALVALLQGPPPAAAQAAQAEQPPTAPADASVMQVRTTATFLRESPSLNGAVIARLERGERVEILERLPGDWWRVRAGRPPTEGYVHRLVLSDVVTPRVSPGLPLPPATPTAEPPTQKRETADARTARPGIGGLAFAGVGLFSPTARESFDAVGITGNPLVVTGGLELTRIYRNLFVRGAADWSEETGERVFLDGSGGRFPLGIPLDIRMIPIDVSAGWRFDGRPAARRRFVPYVGGGAGVLLYRETDEFAEGDEVVDERFTSYHVLGGMDVYFARRAAVRAEFRYRSVPDAIGEAGVSAVTGDTSLGGAVFVVGVVVGR